MKDEMKVCALCLFITTGLSCKDQEMRSNDNHVTFSIEDGSLLNGRGFSVTNGASIRSVVDVLGKPFSIVDIGGGTGTGANHSMGWYLLYDPQFAVVKYNQSSTKSEFKKYECKGKTNHNMV